MHSAVTSNIVWKRTLSHPHSENGPFHIHIQKKKHPTLVVDQNLNITPLASEVQIYVSDILLSLAFMASSLQQKNAQKNLLANIQISEDASKSLQQSWTKINEQR
jgi:hypothetical protein